MATTVELMTDRKNKHGGSRPGGGSVTIKNNFRIRRWRKKEKKKAKKQPPLQVLEKLKLLPPAAAAEPACAAALSSLSHSLSLSDRHTHTRTQRHTVARRQARTPQYEYRAPKWEREAVRNEIWLCSHCSSGGGGGGGAPHHAR